MVISIPFQKHGTIGFHQFSSQKMVPSSRDARLAGPSPGRSSPPAVDPRPSAASWLWSAALPGTWRETMEALGWRKSRSLEGV